MENGFELFVQGYCGITLNTIFRTIDTTSAIKCFNLLDSKFIFILNSKEIFPYVYFRSIMKYAVFLAVDQHTNILRECLPISNFQVEDLTKRFSMIE